MAILYTAKQIQEVLRELRIKPADGKVTTREAARILTWRAKAEHLYRVEDVFDLQLAPRRGIGQQKEAKEEAA